MPDHDESTPDRQLIRNNLAQILSQQQQSGLPLFAAPEDFSPVRSHSSSPRDDEYSPRSGVKLPTKKGFLTKQGGGKRRATSRKNWKSRAFVLSSDSVLNYYKDFQAAEKDVKSLGTIKIKGATIDPADHRTGKSFSFVIIDRNGREWFFTASSPDERDSWVEILRQHAQTSTRRPESKPTKRFGNSEKSSRGPKPTSKVDNSAAQSKVSLGSKRVQKRRPPTRPNRAARRGGRSGNGAPSMPSTPSPGTEQQQQQSGSKIKRLIKFNALGNRRLSKSYPAGTKLEAIYLCSNGIALRDGQKKPFLHPTHYTLRIEKKMSLGDGLQIILSSVVVNERVMIAGTLGPGAVNAIRDSFQTNNNQPSYQGFGPGQNPHPSSASIHTTQQPFPSTDNQEDPAGDEPINFGTLDSVGKLATVGSLHYTGKYNLAKAVDDDEGAFSIPEPEESSDDFSSEFTNVSDEDEESDIIANYLDSDDDEFGEENKYRDASSTSTTKSGSKQPQETDSHPDSGDGGSNSQLSKLELLTLFQEDVTKLLL